MNLEKGMKIKHIGFGEGTIAYIDSNYIYVDFIDVKGPRKKFQIDAIGKFLHFVDPLLEVEFLTESIPDVQPNNFVSTSKFPYLSPDDICSYMSSYETSIRSAQYYRGLGYFNRNHIFAFSYNDDKTVFQAKCYGKYMNNTYNLKLIFNGNRIIEHSCSCPAHYKWGFCKHLVALCLYINSLNGATATSNYNNPDVDLGYDYYKGINGKSKDYAKAYELFLKGANAGDKSGAFYCGYLLDNGLGVDKDYESALKWYKIAASKGSETAINNLATMYEDGEGVEINNDVAFYLYKKAAGLGNSLSQRNVGRMYEAGKGVQQDYEEAKKWYKLAADNGDEQASKLYSNLVKKNALKELKESYEQLAAESYYLAGLEYYHVTGKGSTNDELAFDRFKKAADLGHTKGAFYCGVMYNYGYGVGKDYKQAMKWYKKAAAGGNLDAQNNIGNLYVRGHGVEQDYEEAVKWYKKAANNNYALAQRNLGTMYEYGKGVQQDFEEAKRWYKLAIDNGDKDAVKLYNDLNNTQSVLENKQEKKSDAYLDKALNYYLGENGYPEDDNLAFMLFEKSANLGNTDAYYYLGECYENGYGVEINYNEAYNWYLKSAESGDDDGKKSAQEMLDKLEHLEEDKYGTSEEENEEEQPYFEEPSLEDDYEEPDIDYPVDDYDYEQEEYLNDYYQERQSTMDDYSRLDDEGWFYGD